MLQPTQDVAARVSSIGAALQHVAPPCDRVLSALLPVLSQTPVRFTAKQLAASMPGFIHALGGPVDRMTPDSLRCVGYILFENADRMSSVSVLAPFADDEFANARYFPRSSQPTLLQF